MTPDFEIRQKAEDELRGDPEIDAADIGVTVQGSVVTLHGFVRRYPQKVQAERDAKRVAGVVAVSNNIEVRLPGLDQRPDPETVSDGVNALKVELPFSSERIQVIVENGWLKLEGLVEWSYAGERAENAVRRIRGVKGITSAIMLKPRATPDEIRRRIDAALRRTAEHNGRRIMVDGEGSETVLRGTLKAWAMPASS